MLENRLEKLLLEVGEECRREIHAAVDSLRDKLRPFFQGHRGSAMYLAAENTQGGNAGTIVRTTPIPVASVTDAKAVSKANSVAGNNNLNPKIVLKTVYTDTGQRYYYCFFSLDADPVVIVVDQDGSLYDSFPKSEA